ncbi:MAG TPA: cupin domain-containing protein [Bacteroidales bacterium]|nr:cupin domain-containing protein [Bacteroidales bacterium]
MNVFDDSIYPDIIKNLPDADIPFDGVNGKLLQGENSQAVFFVIDAIGIVPEHSHGAQWGIVFEGEMDLTIGGVTKTFTKGDHYYIPAGVKHSANFKKKTQLMDFFEDKHRYFAVEK